jgi:hypothetical protein
VGITIITPAQHILDWFNSEEVMADREKRADKRKKRAPGARLASGKTRKTEEDEITKAEFEETLWRVTRKKDQPSP